MISVFTPHYAPTDPYIEEAYDSLCAQTHNAWEWVLLVNHGGHVPERVRVDSRVRVLDADDTVETVGGLKRAACALARGEVLVELDADDLLTPNALERVATAFRDPGVGFVYSNTAHFHDKTWEPKGYSAYWGWQERPFRFGQHTLREMVAFPPSPHALRMVWWAPNHVRAWRADTYWRLGGHDPELMVGDDHDLLCRTYLGARMAHLDECLYLERLHDHNTTTTHNAEIQQQCWRNYERYIIPLCERWCALEGLAKIDLGAAHGKPAGYTGYDTHGTDVCCDLQDGIPCAPGTVGIVRAYDVLEHLPNAVHTMNEIHRVLAPGGWLHLSVPSTDGRGAFQDPTHVSFWNANSLWYYTNPQYAAYVPEISARFQVARAITWFPSDWHREHDIPYLNAQLIAVKDGFRAPGECKWQS